MNPNAEFDIIVYGATGYTGRLVAEYLAQRYGVGGDDMYFGNDRMPLIRDAVLRRRVET